MRRSSRKSARKLGRRSRNTRILSERVAELRALTVDAEDLAAPVEYFHDELALLHEFMECGESAVNPMLEQILQQALAHTGFEIEFIIMLIQVAEHGLWHGAAQLLRGGFAVFFYFDALDVGVAQIVTALDETEQHYLRFKCVPLDCSAPMGVSRGGKA